MSHSASWAWPRARDSRATGDARCVVKGWTVGRPDGRTDGKRPISTSPVPVCQAPLDPAFQVLGHFSTPAPLGSAAGSVLLALSWLPTFSFQPTGDPACPEK